MKRMKKLGALLLSLLMVSTTVLGSVTQVSASTSNYLVREYSTGYYSSTDKIIRARVYAPGFVEHYNPDTAEAGNGSSGSGNSSSSKPSEEKPHTHIFTSNTGKWFNTQAECVAYYDNVEAHWSSQLESGKITIEEYRKNCP